MEILAQKSVHGNLSSFSGIFTTQELSQTEQSHLHEILEKYQEKEQGSLENDFKHLSHITSEIKAINSQAILLHGERIKQAQKIFKDYQEGAFSAWLVATYGNRQTPYNFLQYFEFYSTMPKDLHKQIEAMPKQAIYTLASREGDNDIKKNIVESFNGESKQELLEIIRKEFPLSESDKRQGDLSETVCNLLHRTLLTLDRRNIHLTAQKKKRILNLMNEIKETIERH